MKSMRIPAGIISLLILFCAFQCRPPQKSDALQEFIVLKIYHLNGPDQEKELDSYLENALIPALKRYHVRDIGAFKFIPEVQDSLRQLFLLYPIDITGQLGQLPGKLFRDSILREKGDSILQAFDQPPYARMESILLKPFEGMPFLQPTPISGDRNKRVYELRSYESPTESLFRNKVEMFNKGGEIELFKKLGFHAVFYGEVLAGSRMPNLMYMTTFENIKTRDSLWEVFFDSAEWKALINDPYYAGNVNKADILLLTPTGYSDY